MALDKIHLRKVLQYFAMDPKKRASAIRADAREFVRKEKYPKRDGGGDFHSCFWSDAKAFAAAAMISGTSPQGGSSPAGKENAYIQLCKMVS